MKPSLLFITIVLLGTVISEAIIAQPVRDDVDLNSDTTNITLQELTNPSFTNLLVPTSEKPNIAPSSKPVRLNTPTKLLLNIGTAILRGDNDKYPLYSLENAWKYPGPTVQYPKSATEYERFLSRFNRYNPDSN